MTNPTGWLVRDLKQGAIDRRHHRSIAIALAVAYLTSIVLAVVAIAIWGVVPIIGTELMAPAGVYVVGFTLVLRDLLHDYISRLDMAVLIVAGALLSALVSPQLALASGLAFLIAEGLDALIYGPVRERLGQVRGIVLSNAVSIPVDSIIFLLLAFGSLQFFWGQVAGKAIATVLAIVVIVAIRAVRRAR